jgi:DNA-binding NarL/FixJ family response regulator
VTRAPRVLIADDHAATRAGVRMALEHGGCEVCAEAANAPAAIAAAERERPDAALIDLQMPGGGIQAIAAITARLPDTRVIVLTVSADSDDFLDALRAGAAGYLLKDMDPYELAAVVRGALAGEAALPGFLASRLIEEFRHRGDRRTFTLDDSRRVELTPREWDVFELLADGRSTAEIAGRLRLSQVTVRRHVSTLMQKLEVTSREDARRLLATNGRDRSERSSD